MRAARRARNARRFELALVALTGCAAAPKAKPPVETPAPIEAPVSPYASPARWDFHPAQASTPRARVRLGDGTCIVAAETGQRWMVSPKHGGEGALCAGEARTTEWIALGPSGAPEDLVSVVRRGSLAWVFVGASGTIFEASEPLGPFTRTLPSPEPLLRVAGSGPVMLATTRNGKLLRWDEAGGWREVTSIGARVFDVEVDESGNALALGMPEALFTSTDAGVTWTRPSPAPKAVGAQKLGTTASGDLAAIGLVDVIAWHPNRSPAFEKGAQAVHGGANDVDVEPGPHAGTTAMENGRAFADGDRYFEVARSDHPDAPWTLGRGRIEGRLDVTPIVGTEGCGSVKLGGAGKTLIAACVHESDGGIAADILRSDDAGKTFRPAAQLTTIDTDKIWIAVSPDGSALVTGVCKIDAASACDPTSPLLLRPDGAALHGTRVASPAVSGPAYAPAFSSDGRSAYFLGLRGKDQTLALFVSHDGGETFAERTLSIEHAAGIDPDANHSPSGAPAWSDDLHDVRPSEPAAIHIGEDGSLGIALILADGPGYLTTDDDGRGMRLSRPPAGDGQLAGFGHRVLALTEGGEKAWESLDGGSLWTEIPTAIALRGGVLQGTSIVCVAAGCMIGDVLSRAGWSGQIEPMSLPSKPPDPQAATGQPAIRTPIVCQLATSSAWTRIDDISNATDAWGVPTIETVMRGRSVWSVVSSDPKKGTAQTTTAILPEKGDGESHVVQRVLLGKPRSKGPFATHVTRQIEGYAADRVAYAEDDKHRVARGRMSNVELAWENFMDGTSGREKIADAGDLGAEDVRIDDGAATLVTSFLSVSPRGIFFRPHASRPESLWIEPGAKPIHFDYPTWPARGPAGAIDFGNSEAVFANGKIVAVGIVRSGEILTLGRPSEHGAGWDMTTTALASMHDDDAASSAWEDWAYRGPSEVGQTVLEADPTANVAWAYFAPFRGDGTFGAATPLPTPLDLGDMPRACTNAERAASARLAAVEIELLTSTESRRVAKANFIGTRHPILVAGVLDSVSEPRGSGAGHERARKAIISPLPHLLLTNAVVLHGTPANPCVAGWTAIGAENAELSAVVSGDLREAFLFRPLHDAAPDAAPPKKPSPNRRAAVPENAIEYRRMSCAYDANAPVPDTVWSEVGTLRTIRP